MFSLMYLQDSKLFRFCQVRNEDIDMSYVDYVPQLDSPQDLKYPL